MIYSRDSNFAGIRSVTKTTFLLFLILSANPLQADPRLEGVPQVEERGRVGRYVELSGSLFMVWGGARSGIMPKGLMMSADGKHLYASHIGRNDRETIAVYQPIPFSFTRFIDLEGTSIELAESVDRKWIFSTNMKNWGYLDVLDPKTLERKKHIRVTGFPKFILPDPSGRYLYLSLWSGEGIARMSWPEGKVKYLKTQGLSRFAKKDKHKNPRGMAFSPDRKVLYVANNNDRSLTLIDTETFKEITKMDIGITPRHIVPDPNRNRLYISLTGPEQIAVLDTDSNKVIKRVRVGSQPKTIDISHDGKFLYVGNYKGSSLHIVDLDSWETAELELNVLRVSGMAVHPSDDFLYATGWCTGDVWAIQRIDPGEHALLPLGQNRDNDPCYDCPSSFTGCPTGRRKQGK